MGDTNYQVTTDLKVMGARAYAGDLKTAAAGARDLHAAAGKLGSGVLGLAGGAFRALETSVLAVGAAASAAFGGAVFGVGKLASAIGSNLSDLEGSAIQLGAVIGAATGTGFAKGQAAAKGLFEEFQDLAITSQGETQDFVNISKGIAGPVLHATHSLDKLRDMTQKVVNVAGVVGETYEEAGRDTSAILGGVAGNDVKLFRTLKSMGLIKKEAKDFNALPLAKRVAELDKALGNSAIADSAAAFGNTWKGLVSSFQDSSKAFGRLAGSGVFGFLKGQLTALNTVMQDQVKGGKLADAFEHLGGAVTFSLMNLRDALGDLFPDAVGSASGFVKGVERVVTGGLDLLTKAARFAANHWDEIRAAVDKTAAALGRAADKGAAFVRAVGGGDMLLGAERLGGAYAGVKGAQALGVPELVGSGAMAVSGAAGTAKALGLFGGGAAVAAEGAGAAAAGGGAAAGGVAGTAGVAAAAGIGAVGLAAVVIALEAVGAVALAVKHNSLGLADTFDLVGTSLKQGFDDLDKAVGPLWKSIKQLWTAAEPLIGVLGALIFHLSPIGIVFRILGVAVPILEVALSKVAEAATWAIKGLAGVVDWLTEILHIKRKLDPVDEEADREAERKRRAAIDYSRSNAGMIQSQDGRTLVNLAKGAENKEPVKVDVTLKLEFEGDADAVYVLTGRQIAQAVERQRDNPDTFRVRT